MPLIYDTNKLTIISMKTFVQERVLLSLNCHHLSLAAEAYAPVALKKIFFVLNFIITTSMLPLLVLVFHWSHPIGSPDGSLGCFAALHWPLANFLPSVSLRAIAIWRSSGFFLPVHPTDSAHVNEDRFQLWMMMIQ